MGVQPLRNLHLLQPSLYFLEILTWAWWSVGKVSCASFWARPFKAIRILYPTKPSTGQVKLQLQFLRICAFFTETLDHVQGAASLHEYPLAVLHEYPLAVHENWLGDRSHTHEHIGCTNPNPQCLDQQCANSQMPSELRNLPPKFWALGIASAADWLGSPTIPLQIWREIGEKKTSISQRSTCYMRIQASSNLDLSAFPFPKQNRSPSSLAGYWMPLSPIRYLHTGLLKVG